MPAWSAVAYGVAISAVLAAAAVALLLGERRLPVLASAAVAAAIGPLAWDLILRDTGGQFFVDAPIVVFPVSYEDTGSGVFATAFAVLILGLGPMRADVARQLTLTAATCGVAALVVDIYLY
jgi:hypothetical protein